ncbi:conserved hypothetical protein [Paenibacillus curdlanolyticus YK9]|uniref:RNA helicase n=1 Tax=Paenibacillus curdlanolyticus YK9 TaxID=717606 RepID=E0I4Z9_9BACL|nr:hypothetical protein [Paenibacillus curdlanolyticus]EFM12041.1 conserved hypothetical protein [Paenibacillus curdlanolyticus YK9]
MNKLTYYIKTGYDQYQTFMSYYSGNVGIDEMYARQLCTYLVANGRQYELLSNEMQYEEEALIIKELGPNERYMDEVNYRGQGIFVEFRKPSEGGRRLAERHCSDHYSVMRYLLKDVVDVPGFGQMYTTSTEVDEDRGCYVVYVKGLEE